MKMFASVLLGALLAFGTAATANAQDAWELNLHGGVFQRDLGFDDDENDDDTDTDPMFGARLFRHWANGFGIGGNFDWVLLDEFDNPETAEDDDVNVNLFYYSGELVYTFPTESRVKFGVSAGAGAATTQFDDLPGADDFADESFTDFMVPIGVNLKFVNDEVDPSWGLRIDGRDNIIWNEPVFDVEEQDVDTEASNNWELSAGISFFFGGGPRFEEPLEPIDSDGDGVADDRDRCPNTPPGTRVDAFGCPVPVDSDGDGVVDDRDRCPNTPAGTPVDSDGCPIVEEEPAACVDGRTWFRNDLPIEVNDRQWVKFGAANVIAEAELRQIETFDGVPVFVRTSAREPYSEIFLPMCAPEGSFQAYRPEQAIRGTTG